MSVLVLVTGREVVRAAHEQVERTCENDERRELGRAAGPELKP
jgi:hypothetical protein